MRPATVVLGTVLLAAVLTAILADQQPWAPSTPVDPTRPQPNRTAPPRLPDLVETPAVQPLAFGGDGDGLAELARLGIPADYGTVWVGDWTLHWGWKEPDVALRGLRAANVTPVVHFYYWGDDLARACFDHGCAGKTQAGWDQLATELATHLNDTMGGAPSLVLLETEFNKADVARHKPLDALLAQKATALGAVPGVQVVLPLGNWNVPAWPTWAAAANASDFVGLQALAGSTRDSPEAAAALAERTLAGAQQLQATFHKPILLHDLAVSSYPEPEWRATQADTVASIFGCLAPLKAAGVEALLYRSLHDVPTMDLKNHYGEAERHFGLADDAGLKPAGRAWLDGVLRERAFPAAAAETAC
ncbi:MAG: hypothetical protein QOD77_1334 [Thermoplasmata archaeon]|jgi:hypothetical protein|nr:hypothetical protein [Thermoplasmata archaeon]